MFCTITVFLFLWKNTFLNVFFPDGVFLPCDYELDFDISLCENSINQSINYRFDPVRLLVVYSTIGSDSITHERDPKLTQYNIIE